MSERRTLLRGGAILTMDRELGDLERGDVLIDGRRIAAIAPSLEVEADEVIDAEGTLILPGLIDSHIHMWQAPLRGLAAECFGMEYFGVIHPLSGRYSPEDMYASTYACAIELLSHGVTTAFDFCHSVNSPEHADASVAALRDAGIRGLFGYSFRDRPEVERRAFHSHDERIRDAHRLRNEQFGGDDELVQMAIALNNIDHVSAEENANEIGCARDLGVLASVHSITDGQVSLLHERGHLGQDLQWVHVTKITDEELALLAEHGGTISATSECEIRGGLYPITGRARRAGVLVALGSDTPSSINGDPLSVLRLTVGVERHRVIQAGWREGRAPRRTAAAPTLTARDVLELATVESAEALGLGARTGSLTPGKDADILMLSTEPFGLSHGDPAAHVVLQASAADVDTVIVAGTVRKRAGRLVDVDVARMRRQLDEAREHVVGSRLASAVS